MGAFPQKQSCVKDFLPVEVEKEIFPPWGLCGIFFFQVIKAFGLGPSQKANLVLWEFYLLRNLHPRQIQIFEKSS